MPNGRCRMHGGMSPGAPKGNKNAFKHGHYAAEAIASRREIAKLLRDARALVKQLSNDVGYPLHAVRCCSFPSDAAGQSRKLK